MHEPLRRTAGSPRLMSPADNNKLRLISAYFREAGDPDRGYALAALTGALSFKHAKPGLIRDLIAERTDPVLFALCPMIMSATLSETVALMWPKAQSAPSPACGGGIGGQRPPSSLNIGRTPMRSIGYGWGQAASAVPEREPPPGSPDSAKALPNDPTSPASGSVRNPRDIYRASQQPSARPPFPKSSPRFARWARPSCRGQLARWLRRARRDRPLGALETVTGAMRIGISARLAKTAAAALGDKEAQ